MEVIASESVATDWRVVFKNKLTEISREKIDAFSSGFL